MTGPIDLSPPPEDIYALYRRVIDEYGWQSQADNTIEEADFVSRLRW